MKKSLKRKSFKKRNPKKRRVSTRKLKQRGGMKILFLLLCVCVCIKMAMSGPIADALKGKKSLTDFEKCLVTNENNEDPKAMCGKYMDPNNKLILKGYSKCVGQQIQDNNPNAGAYCMAEGIKREYKVNQIDMCDKSLFESTIPQECGFEVVNLSYEEGATIPGKTNDVVMTVANIKNFKGTIVRDVPVIGYRDVAFSLDRKIDFESLKKYINPAIKAVNANPEVYAGKVVFIDDDKVRFIDGNTVIDIDGLPEDIIEILKDQQLDLLTTEK